LALRWGVLVAALAALNFSLTFENVWPTLFVRLGSSLSVELAVFLLAFAGARWWLAAPSRIWLRVLAAAWAALVVGRFVDVTTRSLYGRELNLYWDLRYIPDVSAMLAFVAEPWMVVLVAGGAVLLPLIVYLPVRWAIGYVSDAFEDARARRAVAALAAVVLLLAAGQRTGWLVAERLTFAEPVTAAFARQARQLTYELSGAGLRALPPAPRIESNLARVRGADVFLTFLESYGAVSWDRPALAEPLMASRARLEADIRASGRRVVSARVESTTFGGESWLAHISLLSGTEVRDQDTNTRLMAQRRDTLVTAFSKAGYRTAVLMPGLQRAWPESAFYGFDDVFGSVELAYSGPPFGWWDVTDQYALARLDALLAGGDRRRPHFVFFPTISTHAPFTPTPPYQPDWSRVLTPTPYDPAELDRAWSGPPDWLNLSPGYVQALDYAHATLGGYLRLHKGRDLVMILVGDHQPPAAVSGDDASWDVPVHLITNRQDVLEALLRKGFAAGLEPPRERLTTMHGLLPVLLDAFGDESLVPPAAIATTIPAATGRRGSRE
jgi:hypothetical protein